MSVIKVFQITVNWTVCSKACSGWQHTKHHSSALVFFMKGTTGHRHVDSFHKGPEKRRAVPYHDFFIRFDALTTWGPSQQIRRLTSIGIPIIKTRRPSLLYNGNPIPWKTVFILPSKANIALAGVYSPGVSAYEGLKRWILMRICEVVWRDLFSVSKLTIYSLHAWRSPVSGNDKKTVYNFNGMKICQLRYNLLFIIHFLCIAPNIQYIYQINENIRPNYFSCMSYGYHRHIYRHSFWQLLRQSVAVITSKSRQFRFSGKIPY